MATLPAPRGAPHLNEPLVLEIPYRSRHGSLRRRLLVRRVLIALTRYPWRTRTRCFWQNVVTVFLRRRHQTRSWRDPAVRQEALEELLRAVAVASDAQSLRILVARRFQALTDCDAVWFLELGRSGGVFESTRFERGQSSNVHKLALAVDGPLATWLQLNEEPLVFPGKSGIESFLDPDERRQLEEEHIGACLPIFAVGTLRAIVLLESRHAAWELSRELGSFLMACGRHAGLAYETLERHEAQVDDVRNAAHAQRLAVAGQLASMMAHEIRNPLGIIRSSIQIVRDSAEGWDKRQMLLTDAMSEIDRIADTISGFLSLSRPATRHEEPIDLVELIEATVRVLTSYADGRRVEISTLNEFPRLRVSGDPRELRQVFLNILLNATQTIVGAGTVVIRTSLFDEPRRDGTGHRTMTLVAISDSGPGIPPDVIDRMFEPFVSTKVAGTGLGLAICSQIVDRHGGRIWAQNEQPQGATISVSLPLKTGD